MKRWRWPINVLVMTLLVSLSTPVYAKTELIDLVRLSRVRRDIDISCSARNKPLCADYVYKITDKPDLILKLDTLLKYKISIYIVDSKAGSGPYINLGGALAIPYDTPVEKLRVYLGLPTK